MAFLHSAVTQEFKKTDACNTDESHQFFEQKKPHTKAFILRLLYYDFTGKSEEQAKLVYDDRNNTVLTGGGTHLEMTQGYLGAHRNVLYPDPSNYLGVYMCKKSLSDKFKISAPYGTLTYPLLK